MLHSQKSLLIEIENVTAKINKLAGKKINLNDESFKLNLLYIFWENHQ